MATSSSQLSILRKRKGTVCCTKLKRYLRQLRQPKLSLLKKHPLNELKDQLKCSPQQAQSYLLAHVSYILIISLHIFCCNCSISFKFAQIQLLLLSVHKVVFCKSTLRLVFPGIMDGIYSEYFWLVHLSGLLILCGSFCDPRRQFRSIKSKRTLGFRLKEKQLADTNLIFTTYNRSQFKTCVQLRSLLYPQAICSDDQNCRKAIALLLRTSAGA